VATGNAILSSGVQKLNKNRFKTTIIIMKFRSADLPPRQQVKKC